MPDKYTKARDGLEDIIREVRGIDLKNLADKDAEWLRGYLSRLCQFGQRIIKDLDKKD